MKRPIGPPDSQELDSAGHFLDGLLPAVGDARVGDALCMQPEEVIVLGR
ncbi:MAG: hypothetical protein ACLP59_23815 [Bryobacteraceae bacterium]